ncbi:MAG TPA: 23S rRNA (adenine(2503)-C(2))-methyltransferase RlmN [Clostridiaceae bacterium]|nr:23S rRNA (adenine(2503)-C(2))-methyltransferase RlmN [Clostridiaceae bacterium]
MENKINLMDLSVDEIEKLLVESGVEKYRALQIFQWVSRGKKDFDEMTNLSKALREKLKERFYIGKLETQHRLVSKIDGTVKYIFRLEDGNIIESVLMHYKHGYTACISSQVGCRMGCKFCASTGLGCERNLTSGEMLDQIITIQNIENVRIGNIVIMGIGEPMDNYDNVIKFLKLVNSKEGLNIGYRHISVSTCGLVPQILKLADEGMPITLSISLHAPNDEIRNMIMPVNRRYSIDKLIEACKIYIMKTKRRITFEYAMISGINDSSENASELAHRIKGMLCHVNLIPVNDVEGVDYRQSDKKRIEKFQEILEQHGIETTVRRELGSDIKAACGQLRRSIM